MKRALWIALPLLIAAAPGQDAPKPYALATFNVQRGGTRDADGVYRGGAFKSVDRFDPPAEHGPRDALIAFEGPGWETDKIAYRLYLDERNVPDIYGKRLPGPVLPRIGQGKDDYHSMADWGQDIFQVDQSLGMGGIGVLREGKATQIGPSRIIAEIGNYGHVSEVHVENHGFAGADGPADLATSYVIAAGSRVTQVSASVKGKVPQMVAGLRHHAGVESIRSLAQGRWRYIATWGVQSLAKDHLGIALFYRADQVSGDGDDGQTWFVRFTQPDIRYAFGAVWEQEPGAAKDLAGFRDWLDQVDAELEKNDATAG